MELNVFAICFVMCWCDILAHSEQPKLLLISLDGFRWDYLDRVKESGRKTPNFDRLIEYGVLSTVKNSYITKTFPNHYTIVTGMYEENHGIVANEMFDPVFNEVFTNTKEQSQESKWWDNGDEHWKGEPIWLRNENAAEGSLFPRHSGVFFWPGSEAPIHGKHPTHFEHYNGSVPYHTRIDTIVSWFSNDEMPINLGVLYFEEPDRSGHILGPNDEKLLDIIVELDGDIGYLLEVLKNNELLHELNIIITSDHGMVEITDTLYLEDHVNVSCCQFYGSSPVLNILPSDTGRIEEIYTSLKASNQLHVFKKEDIPAEYHYKNNRRIQPLVVSSPEGYNLCVRNDSECNHNKGNHGYNNSLPNMHPIFIGYGPAFKKGFKSSVLFNNVDIYPLMCEILDVKPAQNDGNFNNVKHLLQPHDNSTTTILTYMLCIAFVTTIAGIMSFAVLRIQRYHKHKQLYPKKSLSHDVYIDESEIDGRSHLLLSEEEEIP